MKKKKYDGPLVLAEDWMYSTPYEVNEREEEPVIYPVELRPFIHAYHARAEARKKRFLRDASNYLIGVGRELERYGFREAAARINPGGIAVSGDVDADYYPETITTPHDRFIHLNISQTCVSILGEAPPIGVMPTTLAFTTRHDSICIMGRWHEPPPPGERGVARGARSTIMGPNHWFDANTNCVDLAAQVALLLDLTPLPVAVPIQTNLFGNLHAA
jgi:hypothetical protein